MTVANDLHILLAPGIFPPDSGGPATFAPDIGRALVRRGHSVRTITNGTAPEGFDQSYPFKIVRIPRGETILGRYARQIWTLVSEIRDFDADIVFTNAFDLQVVTAGRLTRTPVLTKVVGDNAWERARRNGLVDDIKTFQRRRYGPKVEGFKLLRSFQTRGADHVVVPSEYLRNLVKSWGIPHQQISVIYNSLDIERRDVPEANRTNRIITAGRLVPWKGIDGIIDAFAKLKCDAELHIIGNGPERQTLERRADESGRRDDIVFHGRVEHDRVLELVSHSRLFVLNSTYEGLPHVVIEAMACGTPVVASAAGGTPEAVVHEESGLLVDPGDVAALADIFNRLLTNFELRAMLRKGGFEQLDTKFDHEGMVGEYERILQEVASL